MEFRTSPTDFSKKFWDKSVADVVTEEKEGNKKRKKAETASDDWNETSIPCEDEINMNARKVRTLNNRQTVQVQAKRPPPPSQQHSNTSEVSSTTNTPTTTNKPKGKKATGGTKMWNAKPAYHFGRPGTLGFAGLAKMSPLPGAFSSIPSPNKPQGKKVAGTNVTNIKSCFAEVVRKPLVFCTHAPLSTNGFESVPLGSSAAKGFGSGIHETRDSTTASMTGFASVGTGAGAFGSVEASLHHQFAYTNKPQSAPDTRAPAMKRRVTKKESGLPANTAPHTVPEAVMSNVAIPGQSKKPKNRKKAAPAIRSPGIYMRGLDRVSEATMTNPEMKQEILHRRPNTKGICNKLKMWFVEQLGEGSLREEQYIGPIDDLPRVDGDCSNRLLMQELRFRRPGFKNVGRDKKTLLQQLVVGTVLLTSELFEQRIMGGIITKKGSVPPTLSTPADVHGDMLTGNSDEPTFPGLAPVVPDVVQSIGNLPVSHFKPEPARRTSNKRKRSADGTRQAPAKRMKPKREQKRKQVAPTGCATSSGARTAHASIPKPEIRRDIHGQEYCCI